MVLTFWKEDCSNCCCPSWTERGIRVCLEQRETEKRMDMVYQLCALSFVLASIAIERVGIYIVSWSCGGPSQWKPIENSLSRHRLHRHYKNRIIRECTKRFWANFLLIREKKWTILKRYKDIQMVVYWYNMGFLFVYRILWFFMMSCQSLMVWYNKILLASILNLYKIKLSNS